MCVCAPDWKSARTQKTCSQPPARLPFSCYTGDAGRDTWGTLPCHVKTKKDDTRIKGISQISTLVLTRDYHTHVFVCQNVFTGGGQINYNNVSN